MARVHVFCVLLLASSTVGPVLSEEEQSYWDKARDFGTCYGWPIAAGVVGVVAAPIALPALGFGAGGIAAGSIAAKGMSLAATSGYGMGAIAAAQSAGAAGLGVGTQVAAGVVSSLTGWYVGGCTDPDCEKEDKEK